MRFAKVEDGIYAVRELLTGDTTTLTISGNKGRIPMTWKARDTRVFEIPALREKGRKNLLPGDRPASASLGIYRPDGKRIDILGRSVSTAPKLMWSAPAR
jgi:hypothetical protein